MFTIIIGICIGAVILGFSIWGGVRLDSIFNSLMGFMGSTGKSLVIALFVVFVLVIFIKLFSKIKFFERADNYSRNKVQRKRNSVEYKEIKNRERYGNAQYKNSMKTFKSNKKKGK